MSSGSWTRLSSSPSVSNWISWQVSSGVRSRPVDVTDSDRGLKASDGDFGSQRVMCVQSDDTRQIHSSSATYSWDVFSQRRCHTDDTFASAWRWCVSLLLLVDVLLRWTSRTRESCRQSHVTESHPAPTLQHTTHSRYQLYQPINDNWCYFWRTSPTWRNIITGVSAVCSRSDNCG